MPEKAIVISLEITIAFFELAPRLGRTADDRGIGAAPGPLSRPCHPAFSGGTQRPALYLDGPSLAREMTSHGAAEPSPRDLLPAPAICMAFGDIRRWKGSRRVAPSTSRRATGSGVAIPRGFGPDHSARNVNEERMSEGLGLAWPEARKTNAHGHMPHANAGYR